MKTHIALIGAALTILMLTCLATPTLAQGPVDPAGALKEHFVNTQNSPVGTVKPQLSGIANGDFEAGSAGWTEYSSNGYDLILSDSILPVAPHSGHWAVWLGGADNETAYVEQQVTIASHVELIYWHWIASEDLCGYDFGSVHVNGVPVDVYDLCNAEGTEGWVQHTVDLSDYAGETVALQIRAETDSSANSNLFVDDVSLTSSESTVFLPLVFHNYCGLSFFDDFSDPNSGWDVRSDDHVTAGYYNGEYRITVDATWDYWTTIDKIDLPQNYSVEVDARQAISNDSSYALLFGWKWTYTGFGGYQLQVFPQDQDWQFGKLSLDGNWTALIELKHDPVINKDSSNHMRADRIGSQIKLYLNGKFVGQVSDSTYGGSGLKTGVFASAGDDAIDIRYDNFGAYCLP
jgi:hypothetical protein